MLAVSSPDSLVVDTAEQKKNRETLEYKVEYSAKDSLRFDIKNQIMFLYGEAEVHYGETVLTADYIELGLKNNELFAKGTIDSSDNYIGKPYFEDGGQGFTTDSMKYNFKSKKGKIYEAKTQEGDGYIHGENIKKTDDDILYIRNGKYTTCSLDTPHFHIQAEKLKIIKNDKIITGPANLRVADIPTPLVLPFGFFPNKKGQSSGIIIPTYGESPTQGFFLNNGGYYLGLNDYMDAKLLADIYSRGSWAGKTDINYRLRYKFSGNFNMQYSVFKQSEKELPDYNESNNFFVRWRHSQDPKAKPNSDFSADVNAGSASNFRDNLNTTTSDYFSNTFKSNITYRKTFPIFGKSSSLVFNANHDQNTRDSTLNISLPQLQFNLNERWYPLKRTSVSGAKRWYEDVGISYSADLQNRLPTKEDPLLFDWNVQKERLQNGMRHSIPINLPTFKVFKFLNFSPRINYTDIWYLKTFDQHWDIQKSQVVIDTIKKFDRYSDYSMSGTFTTKLYGMYGFKGNKLAIRHVLTPSIGATFKPDFSKDRFGYYKEYIRTDTSGNPLDTVEYSRFSGIYGEPGKGESGVLNFSLINNLEMKVKSKKDTVTGFKKIVLFESIYIGGSYDLFKDSMKLSTINFNGRTNLFKSLNLNFSGDLNPYQLDFKSKQTFNKFEVETYDWLNGGKLVRLTSANVALSINLKGESKTPEKKESKFGTQQEKDYIKTNPDLYLDWNIPWSLNINYNLRYSKPTYNPTFTNTITINGDVSLTEKWKVGFNSGYDVVLKKITYTTLDIYRDLHCWEIRFHVIPFGERQSYRFDIQVKAPILQDLKLTRKREWYDRTGF